MPEETEQYTPEQLHNFEKQERLRLDQEAAQEFSDAQLAEAEARNIKPQQEFVPPSRPQEKPDIPGITRPDTSAQPEDINVSLTLDELQNVLSGKSDMIPEEAVNQLDKLMGKD